MLKRILLFLILLFLFFPLTYSQDISIHYPWNNRISDLDANIDDVSLPLLFNGSGYRIIGIDNFDGQEIVDINILSNCTDVEVFYLPIIEDYKDRRILDLVVPLNTDLKFHDLRETKYFLIKFRGAYAGKETVRIDIITNTTKYTINKDVVVSKVEYKKNLHLNVWSYFDYNFLVKNIKPKVINDLIDHNVDVLVIPPNAFPGVGPVQPEKINKLRNYLEGTRGKFKYYVLYFGYNENSNYVLTQGWKNNLLPWYESISKVFREQGISHENVLFYPFDEPKAKAVSVLEDMYDYCRKVGIKNPFFATISRPETINLAKRIEYIQAYSGNMELITKMNYIKKKESEVWIYEIPAGSRNLNATFYRNIGLKAFLVEGKGIGVWNYADIKSGISAEGIKRFERGRGSWSLNMKNSVRDYSLIYRKGNQLFSSLRWDALAYSMEDHFFMQLYASKHSLRASNSLVHNILSGKVNPREWEMIKLNLIN